MRVRVQSPTAPVRSARTARAGLGRRIVDPLHRVAGRDLRGGGLTAIVVLSLLGATAALAPGCQSRPRELEPGDPWPFRPTSMRIHPLTRFVEPDEFGPVIELHLEFTDVDGHDSRAVGEVVVRLTARGDVEAEPLEWRIDLDDLATNARLFRGVTRTYEVPLSVRWERPPTGATVGIEATHDDGAGALHRASIVLERR